MASAKPRARPGLPASASLAAANPVARVAFDLLARVRGYARFKPLTYGYANARVHGMASSFLSPAQVREMAAARGMDSLVEMLQRTIYREDLVALSLEFKGVDLVELAVGRHFAHFVRTLESITPPEGRATVRALVSRWDAHNLKTVLLARRQGKSYEQISPYLVIAASLREADLRALMAAPGGEAFFAALRATPFGEGFLDQATLDRDGLRQMLMARGEGDQMLEPLMGALDTYTYHLIARSADRSDEEGRAVARMIAQAADEKNLSTVLRLARAGSKPEGLRRYLVEGGSIEAAEWIRIAQLGDAGKMLDQVSRKLPMHEAMEEYRRTQTLSSIEIALASSRARQGLKFFRRSGLGLGVIVEGLLLKEQEMSNIRKVARGHSMRLPADEILKTLVMVG